MKGSDLVLKLAIITLILRVSLGLHQTVAVRFFLVYRELSNNTPYWREQTFIIQPLIKIFFPSRTIIQTNSISRLHINNTMLVTATKHNYSFSFSSASEVNKRPMFVSLPLQNKETSISFSVKSSLSPTPIFPESFKFPTYLWLYTSKHVAITMYFRSNMLILYISYEYSNLCFDVEYSNLHIVGTPSKQDPFNPIFIEVSDALLKTL